MEEMVGFHQRCLWVILERNMAVMMIYVQARHEVDMGEDKGAGMKERE